MGWLLGTPNPPGSSVELVETAYRRTSFDTGLRQAQSLLRIDRIQEGCCTSPDQPRDRHGLAIAPELHGDASRPGPPQLRPARHPVARAHAERAEIGDRGQPALAVI